MPVRKIPKNYLGVTGRHSSRKNSEIADFESLLEKDFMILLDFDNTVEDYDWQPVRIPVVGIPRGYVPDILVSFINSSGKSPMLVEVKSTDFLEKNKAEYAPKFAAAKEYCAANGWTFSIATEKEIRTPRLQNFKFLKAYRNLTPDEADLDRMLDTADRLGDTASVIPMLEELSESEDDRLYWLPIIWHAVAHHWLECDLDVEFTDDVKVCLPGVE